MQDVIQTALASTLLRILDSEPQIRLNDAIERVVQSTDTSQLESVNEAWIRSQLAEAGNSYKRKGVINPTWLADNGLKPHFFLINAGAGWLDTFMPSSEDTHAATSQYILYGDWDALLVLYGTDEEAERQRELITPTLPAEPRHFSASRVPYLYRHRERSYNKKVEIPCQNVNEVALDYDNESQLTNRKDLEKAGILLGSVWMPDSLPKETVYAFTGIEVSRHAELTGKVLLDSLLQNDLLRRTLIHLFEVDQGRPHHFYAKLACQSMSELDEATDAIGLTRIGPLRLSGSTVVVANGVDQLPIFRQAEATPLTIGVRPLVEDIQYMAKDLIQDLGDEAVASFNNLDPQRKMVVLTALKRVLDAAKIGGWQDEWAEQFLGASDSFAREVLKPSILGRLTGPLMTAATAVEPAVKRAVRGLIDENLDGNYALAQKELGLPSKDLRLLSLGRAVETLHKMAADKRFDKRNDALAQENIDLIREFADSRNAWAHGEPPGKSELDIIDYASRTLEAGMMIARWAAQELPLPAPRKPKVEKSNVEVTINLPRMPKDRESGSFLCHSSQDREMVVKIAQALLATGYQVWYSEWEIGPGDSIVQKVEDGLARNDTLIVILSPASVASKWVRQEIDTALMKQLSGQDVKIIPVLIKDCDVPGVLKSLLYIDFRKQFQEGILKLIQALATRSSK